MTTSLDTMLTRSQAARRLGVSAETIGLWMRSGKLPSLATPLGRLIRSEDIEALRRARARDGREARDDDLA